VGKIVTVGMSPTIQKTITFDSLAIDAVNRSTGYRLDASGKAVNAARVLDQLEPGRAVSLCPLGTGNSGLFLSLAERDGLEIARVDAPGMVRYCYTLVEQGASRATELVVDEPAASADWDSIARAVESLADRLLDGADALLFAGSTPSFWPGDLPSRIVALARKRGIPAMADFRGRELARTLAGPGVDVIKINEAEFLETFGHEGPVSEDALAALVADRSAETGSAIVVTRGSKASLAASAGASYRCPVEAIVPLNTIGSGDAFSAGFLFEWLRSRDVARALGTGTDCARRNALSLRPGSILSADAPGEGVF
jgi:fructose-1-phosphate kinase PfkB-like protein